MEFKKINAREIILISIAGFLILITLVSNFKPKSVSLPDSQIQPAILPSLPPADAPVRKIMDEEDDAGQKEMKEQMDKDRNQQRQIKMLKMQLEQVNLQLDNEKALTEINKLKRENAGYVKDSNLQTGAGFPNIRIIYIGGADMDREAILSIDGTSYSVKEKDRPVPGMEVLSVTDKGIKLHFSTPQELTTVINYIQD